MQATKFWKTNRHSFVICFQKNRLNNFIPYKVSGNGNFTYELTKNKSLARSVHLSKMGLTKTSNGYQRFFLQENVIKM